MLLIPNSLGTDRGAVLREFNPCHDPKTGKFSPRASGDCDPGSLQDPGRQRAVFAQKVPDAQGLAFNAQEAAHAEDAIAAGTYSVESAPLSRLATAHEQGAVKDQIVRSIAPALAADHQRLEELAYDPEFHGFMVRYPLTGEVGGPEWRTQLARNVTSALIQSWADSSSDSNVKSVALQVAAERLFKLGATYSPTLQAGGVYDRAATFYERHRVILDTFLTTMHDHTQQWMAANKVGTNGYVTLYRGWHGSTRETGLKSIRPQGKVADVLLQPMSSFSADFETAYSFATSGGTASNQARGGGGVNLLMAVRVPTSRVIATARTGYGALNEREFVVMGGRYPSFLAPAMHVRSKDHFHELAKGTRG